MFSIDCVDTGTYWNSWKGNDSKGSKERQNNNTNINLEVSLSKDGMKLGIINKTTEK